MNYIVCTQVCTDVGGAYGGRWASDGDKTNITHAHLVGFGGVCMVCTVLRTLSDLRGGVNGHDVNLRDKCGVCDDVTG